MKPVRSAKLCPCLAHGCGGATALRSELAAALQREAEQKAILLDKVAELNASRDEAATLHEEVAELNENLQSLKESTARLEGSLSSQIRDQRGKVESLQRDLADCNDALCKAATEREQAKANLKRAEEEKRAAVESCSRAERALKVAEQHLKDKDVSSAKGSGGIDTLREQLAEAEARIVELEKNCLNQLKATNALRKQLMESGERSRKAAETAAKLGNEVKTKDAVISQLQQEVQKLECDLSEKTEAVVLLQQQLVENERSTCEIIAGLEEDLRLGRETIRKLQNSQKRKEGELTNQMNGMKESHVKELDGLKESHVKELDGLKARCAELEKEASFVGHLHGKLSGLGEQLYGMQQALEAREAELAGTKEKLEEAREETARLHERLSGANMQVAKLEGERVVTAECVEGYRKHIKALEDQCSQMEASLQDRVIEATAAQDENVLVHSQLAEAHCKIGEMENEANLALRRLQERERELEEVQQQSLQIVSSPPPPHLQRQITALRSSGERAARERDALVARAEGLEYAMQQLHRDAGSAQIAAEEERRRRCEVEMDLLVEEELAKRAGHELLASAFTATILVQAWEADMRGSVELLEQLEREVVVLKVQHAATEVSDQRHCKVHAAKQSLEGTEGAGRAEMMIEEAMGLRELLWHRVKDLVAEGAARGRGHKLAEMQSQHEIQRLRDEIRVVVAECDRLEVLKLELSSVNGEIEEKLVSARREAQESADQMTDLRETIKDLQGRLQVKSKEAEEAANHAFTLQEKVLELAVENQSLEESLRLSVRNVGVMRHEAAERRDREARSREHTIQELERKALDAIALAREYRAQADTASEESQKYERLAREAQVRLAATHDELEKAADHIAALEGALETREEECHRVVLQLEALKASQR